MFQRVKQFDDKKVIGSINTPKKNFEAFINYDPSQEKDKMNISAFSTRDLMVLLNTSADKLSPEMKLKKEMLDEHIKAEESDKFVVSGDEWIIPSPNFETERECILIAGQSGAGKSTWIRNYALQYKKFYPKRAVYLISRKTEDSSLSSDIKNKYGFLSGKLQYTQITITEESAALLDYTFFTESLVILDDALFQEKNTIKRSIEKFQNDILQLGRSLEISCLISKHVLNNGEDTRVLKAECHGVVVYPNHSDKNHIINYLKSRMFSKDQINKILKTRSRYVYIRTATPLLVYEQQKIYPY
jgi:predicted ATP-dependent serine protease